MGHLSVLFFIATIAVVAFQMVFKRNYFSPGALYLCVLFGTLGIAFIPGDPAMTPFHPLTWLVLASSALAFVAGTSIARVHFLSESVAVPNDSPTAQQVKNGVSTYRWKRHILLTTLGASSFFASCVVLYLKIGNVTILNDNIKGLMAIGGLDIGYWQFPLVLYPIWLMLFIPATFKKLNPFFALRLYARIMLLLIAVAGFAFFPARGPLMHTMIFAAAFTNMVIIRLKLRHFFGGLLAILLLFLVSANAKGQISSIDFTKVELWRFPYVYVANNYWNLDYALNPEHGRLEHPVSWGHHILGGMLLLELWPDWAGIGESFGFDAMSNKSAEKVQGLNTSGYWWSLYKDFRMFGVVLLPFLGGLFQGWLYNRVRLKPTMPAMMTYGYITIFIVLAFFADFWAIVSAPISIVIFTVLTVLCHPKEAIET